MVYPLASNANAGARSGLAATALQRLLRSTQPRGLERPKWAGDPPLPTPVLSTRSVAASWSPTDQPR